MPSRYHWTGHSLDLSCTLTSRPWMKGDKVPCCPQSWSLCLAPGMPCVNDPPTSSSPPLLYSPHPLPSCFVCLSPSVFSMYNLQCIFLCICSFWSGVTGSFHLIFIIFCSNLTCILIWSNWHIWFDNLPTWSAALAHLTDKKVPSLPSLLSLWSFSRFCPFFPTIWGVCGRFFLPAMKVTVRGSHPFLFVVNSKLVGL